MQLGALLARLETTGGAQAALEALGDIVLYAKVAAAGERFGEAPGEYVSAAARRFAAEAEDDAWLDLVGAIERSADPPRTALERMVRWALAVDADGKIPGCGCAGAGAAGGLHERA
jgi:hypothetical protein